MFAATFSLSDLDGSNGFVLTGIDPFDGSGHSVSSAGDVNADGIDDLIIGAPGADPNDVFIAGESYVLFGSTAGFSKSLSLASLNGSNGFRLDGFGQYDYSGFSVAGAGDVNGDGIGDIVIGAPNFNDQTGPFTPGAAFVVFGSAGGVPASLALTGLDGSNGFRLTGIRLRDATGFSVDGAGDVYGDGIDDVIIGAPGPFGASGRAGASYVVFGSSGGFPEELFLGSLDGTNGFRLNGIDTYDWSGRSVAGAGDVNGDGIDDLIIGAPRAQSVGVLPRPGPGESYVVFGSSAGFPPSLSLGDLDGSNGFRLDGINARDGSGRAVAGVGDINGDGLADVIIGAPDADIGGESYVVFGASTPFPASLSLDALDGSNGFRLDGIAERDASGSSVAGVGDINGDGIQDLIVGAPFAADQAGESYVVFGSSAGFPQSLSLGDLDGTNGFRLLGINASDYSGRSVAGGGDFNGDGTDDLIIGASRANPNGNYSAGEVYVVFGKRSSEACAIEDATGSSETFKITSGRLQIENFDIDGGSADTSDTLLIDAAGFRASINTIGDLFDFISEIEFEGDGSTDAIYNNSDIEFVLSRNDDGTVKDGVILTGIIGRDNITVKDLAAAGADVFGKFPAKEDDGFCDFHAAKLDLELL